MSYYEILSLIGRIILGLVFFYFGLNHFRNLDNMAGYAKSKGVPLPKLAVAGTGLLLLIGSISISLGIFPLIGIIFISLFFLSVTPLMHDFWSIDDPQERQNQLTQFLKNFAILGFVWVSALSLQNGWTYVLLT